MKKCSECNVEMVMGDLHGEPFTMELDHEVDDFSIRVTDESKTSSFLGIKFPAVTDFPVKAMFCPKCGKVELYVDLENAK